MIEVISQKHILPACPLNEEPDRKKVQDLLNGLACYDNRQGRIETIPGKITDQDGALLLEQPERRMVERWLGKTHGQSTSVVFDRNLGLFREI